MNPARHSHLLLLLWGIVLGCSLSAQADGTVLGKFRNTYYYVALEAEFALEPINDVLLAMDDSVLARVSAKFHIKLNLEGTGKLLNGKVVNYAGKKDGIIRYRFSPSPYGEGVGTCPLVPFHTIAVDPAKIPLGSLVQIDETVGMKLPDGSIHDGKWRAEDIGGAINQDRIDLFVGEGDQGKFLVQAGIHNLQPLTVRLIDNTPNYSCIYQLP